MFIVNSTSIIFIAQVSNQEAMPEGLYIPPYLQNVTQRSIVIMWETSEPVIGVVNYGESERMEKFIAETEPVKIHEIKISGLEPGKNIIIRLNMAM